MAYTAGKTWTVGEILTAADMNTYVRDNGDDLDDRISAVLSGTNNGVGTSETTTSTTYTDLATSGPAVTLTTGAKALVLYGCLMSNGTAGARCFMDFAVSGASSRSADDATAWRFESSAANDQARAMAAFVQGGLTTGSNTFTAKYRVSGGTGTFEDRRIVVIPLS